MCLINFRQGPNGSTGEEEGIYISARIIVHLTAFTLLAKRGEKTERLVQCWDVVEGEDFFFFFANMYYQSNNSVSANIHDCTM